MSKKWCGTVVRLALERHQPGLGNSGCARVRRGASGSCPGAFRGAFGAPKSALGEKLIISEIGSQSPLSDHFGGMFDFKVGRWHCGAHAMAENTESHETCSTLSGNAVNVNILFQGRRMWPLARKSADPGEACGSVLKQYRILYMYYLF